jgi:hypothetical protein
MYVHDFQCPKCKSYYNEHSPLPYPSGEMWCQRCGVICPHDETFWIEDKVQQQPFGGMGQQQQQPFGGNQQVQQPFGGMALQPQAQEVLAPVSRYDQQLVVKLTNTKNYSPVDDAGTALHNKATSKGLASEIIELDPKVGPSMEAKKKFAELTSQSRLYIVGHGEGSTVQGVLAMNLAYDMCHVWGAKRALRVVLVSCKAGDKVETEFGNFAKDFHFHLRRVGRLSTEVAAYTRSVSVATSVFAQKYQKPELEGRKVFYLDDDNIQWMSKDGDRVKVIWYWDEDSGKQLSRTRSEDRMGRKD